MANNTYCTILDLKQALDMSLDGDDVKYDLRLEAANKSATEQIEGFCNRHFYPLKATKLFNGNSRDRLLIPDLISLDANGLKEDTIPDGVYDRTWSDSTPSKGLIGL